MKVFVKYITACLLALSAGMAQAQETTDDMMFNHLSIGGSIGTTGIGVDVAMPATKHFTVRAGVSALPLGTFKIKVANSLGSVYEALNYSTPESSNQANKKVELGVNVTMITGHLLADYYPWKSSCFHVTAGAYFGNNEVVHVFNTEEGSMKFLNEANKRVHTYNELFGTNYPDAGIRFGEYVFTSDERGNMDTRMRVNAVRPYLGIGWGRNFNTRGTKVGFNFDFGWQFWGKPKFNMNNNEQTVKTSDSSSAGVLGILSGFDAWPVLKLRISGDLF